VPNILCFLLVAFLFLSFDKVNAQATKADKKLDSLKQAYRLLKPNAKCFPILIEICDKLNNSGKYGESLDSAGVLLKLAEGTRDRKAVFKAYISKAESNRRLSRFQVSLLELDSAATIWPNPEKPSLPHSSLFNSYALVYSAMGNHQTSIKYALKAVAIDSILQSPELCNSLNSLALSFVILGNYGAAIPKFLKALGLAEKQNLPIVQGRCLINIGSCHLNMGNYEEARKYFLECYKLRKGTNNPQGLAAILGNLGATEISLKNPDKAIAYLKESLFYSIPIKYYPNMASASLNLSKTFKDTKQLDSALKYGSLAVNICNLNKIQNEKTSAYLVLGDVLMDLDRPDSAAYFFQKALENAKVFNTPKDIVKALGFLQKLAEKRNNFKEALELSRKQQALSDSLRKLSDKKNLDKLELEFQTEKKDKQIAQQKLDLSQQAIALLEKEKFISEKALALQIQREATERQVVQNALLQTENENNTLEIQNQEKKLLVQNLEASRVLAKLELEKKGAELSSKKLKEERYLRNGLIIGALALLVIGFLIFQDYRLRRKLQHQAEILNQRRRLSTDLHDDVGATLSSISIYTEAIKNKLKNNEHERVMELVNKIGENSRETISTLGDIVWNINPVNDSAEKLFNRMESTAAFLFTAQNIQFEFDRDEALLNLDFSLEAKQNLYLIFKETINNAVKYSGAKLVRLLIKKAGSNLEMTIEDNGRGFDVNQSFEGNGLKNIRRRAFEMNGTCNINSSTIGTSTVIRIPLASLRFE
jgi:signal transduction histidine kinase